MAKLENFSVLSMAEGGIGKMQDETTNRVNRAGLSAIGQAQSTQPPWPDASIIFNENLTYLFQKACAKGVTVEETKAEIWAREQLPI